MKKANNWDCKEYLCVCGGWGVGGEDVFCIKGGKMNENVLHSFFLSFFLFVTSSTYSLYMYSPIVAPDHKQRRTYKFDKTPLDEESAVADTST